MADIDQMLGTDEEDEQDEKRPRPEDDEEEAGNYPEVAGPEARSLVASPVAPTLPMPKTASPMLSMPAPALPATASVASPMADPMAKYRADQASGAGVNNVSGIGGGILKGLNIAGNIAVPGIMAAIPGTTMHHAAELKTDLGQAGAETAEQQKQAQMGLVNEQTAEGAARIPLINSQADLASADAEAKRNPPAKATKGQLLYDKAGDPIGYQDESGNMMAPDNEKLPPDVKTILASAKPKPPAPDKPSEAEDDQKYEGIVTKQKLGQQVTPEDTAFAAAYEKRKLLGPSFTANQNGPDKASARADKSYQFSSTQLEKLRTPIEAQVAKLSTANTNLAMRSPAADALVAPEILSVMAGGQGSGLRMNEAEISRIVGGRSNRETLKAALNKWQLDPSKALSITDAQRGQMGAILQAATQKAAAKQKVLEDAEGNLLDSDDPKDHRKTVNEAKKNLDDLDSGGTQQEPPRPTNVPPSYKFDANGAKGAGWYKPK